MSENLNRAWWAIALAVKLISCKGNIFQLLCHSWAWSTEMALCLRQFWRGEFWIALSVCVVAKQWLVWILPGERHFFYMYIAGLISIQVWKVEDSSCQTYILCSISYPAIYLVGLQWRTECISLKVTFPLKRKSQVEFPCSLCTGFIALMQHLYAAPAYTCIESGVIKHLRKTGSRVH